MSNNAQAVANRLMQWGMLERGLLGELVYIRDHAEEFEGEDFEVLDVADKIADMIRAAGADVNDVIAIVEGRASHAA